MRDAPTVTTRDQLDALPDDSVVLTDGVPARKHLGDWYFANDDGDGYSSESLVLYLPAPLIWSPDWFDKGSETTAMSGDQYHRLGHIPIWEPCGDGQNRACKLCGFIEPAGEKCGWWSGPAWKCDGETCVCYKPKGHEKSGDIDHLCSCGTWFAGNGLCGHPPEYRASEAGSS